jgi:hypothetical protein
MAMDLRRIVVMFGLLCLLISSHASQAVGQTLGFPGVPGLGSWFGQRTTTEGETALNAPWLVPSVNVAWLTTPNRIHVGYDGLVPPGGCISSFFVYPLGGLQVGASIPLRLDPFPIRLYGSYLFPNNPQASQELTWTTNPPGIREWRHSSSQWFKLGGEMLYPLSGQVAMVGGFRWESLLTDFSDPNPDYIFTIPWMNAQTTVTVYEPYLGVRLQWNPSPGGLVVQCVGFPLLFATIEHFNVCNNSGIPFAHTGNQTATTGFFLEASAEYRFGLMQGVDVTGFIEWNVYQGQCSMNIERHEGGPAPGVTAATVAWSHNISSLALGGKVQVSWNLPF